MVAIQRWERGGSKMSIRKGMSIQCSHEDCLQEQLRKNFVIYARCLRLYLTGQAKPLRESWRQAPDHLFKVYQMV